MSDFVGRKPDFNVSMIDKNTDQKGNIGVAWTQSDGSVRIKLNAFVAFPSNGDLVITCWPNREKEPQPQPQPRKRLKSSEDDEDVPF